MMNRIELARFGFIPASLLDKKWKYAVASLVLGSIVVALLGKPRINYSNETKRLIAIIHTCVRISY